MSATHVEIASKHLAAGFSVIPVKTDGSKKPVYAWKEYQERLPTPEELQKWWGNRHHYGFALIHGKVSGNSEALDFEAIRFFEEFQKLCAYHGMTCLLARIPRIDTPSGGVHLIYRCETAIEGNQKLACCADGTVKIETRGEGGYTIAPGSPKECHPDHKEYILRSGKLSEIPVITAEERVGLLAMARACNEYADPTKIHRLAAPAKDRGGHSEGLRPGDDYNNQVGSERVLDLLLGRGWTVAGQRGDTIDLRRPGKACGMSATLNHCGPGVFYCFTSSAAPFDSDRAYSPFAVFALLECNGDFTEAARQLGAQGFGEQLTSTSKGLKNSRNEAGQGDQGRQLSQLNGLNGFSGTAADENDPWEEPVPFGDQALATFPVEALPFWLSEFVSASSVDIGVPADFMGVQALTVLAAALQKKGRIVGKDGYSEPLNLWCVSVMEPGSRKSAGLSRAVAPLKEYEGEENQRLAPEVERAQSAERVLRQKLALAETAAARGIKSDKDSSQGKTPQEVIDDCLKELLIVEGTKGFRLTADDATPEALQMLLSDHGGRIAVLSAEGGTFQHMAGKYSEKGANVDVYLQSHSGDDIICDRVRDRQHFSVKAPALTLGLAVQPIVVRGLQKNAEFRGKGVIARILFSYPPDNVGYIPYDTPPTPPHVAAGYRTGVRSLIGLVPAINNLGNEIPHEIQLSPEAREVFTQFYLTVQQRQRAGGAFHALRDWASKLHGACLRIAGLLHMAQNSQGGWRLLVEAETMAAAVQIAEYFAAHAIHAFSEMGADKSRDDARAILEWIQRRGAKDRDRFKESEVFANFNSRFKDKEEIKDALKVLIDRSFIRLLPPPLRAEGKAGRSPGPAYQVNPALFADANTTGSQNAQEAEQAGDELTKARVEPSPFAMPEGSNFTTAPRNHTKESNNSNQLPFGGDVEPIESINSILLCDSELEQELSSLVDGQPLEFEEGIIEDVVGGSR